MCRLQQNLGTERSNEGRATSHDACDMAGLSHEDLECATQYLS